MANLRKKWINTKIEKYDQKTARGHQYTSLIVNPIYFYGTLFFIDIIIYEPFVFMYFLSIKRYHIDLEQIIISFYYSTIKLKSLRSFLATMKAIVLLLALPIFISATVYQVCLNGSYKKDETSNAVTEVMEGVSKIECSAMCYRNLFYQANYDDQSKTTYKNEKNTLPSFLFSSQSMHF